LDEQFGKDSETVTLDVMKSVTEMVEEAKISPVHNPNKVNIYTHF
jgi:hypothetical protein